MKHEAEAAAEAEAEAEARLKQVSASCFLKHASAYVSM
jgi:hypothetical protein